MKHRSLRPAIALGVSLMALVLATQPVAAFAEGTPQGDYGLLTVTDEPSQPGIVCIYENNPGATDDELDAIRIKNLWSHGPYHQFTKVGFRYVILRNTPPVSDDVFNKYFTSPIVKKSANDEEVAFFKHKWKAPENTSSQFRVRLVLLYYAKGDPTTVVGRQGGLFEVYKHNHPADGTYTVGDNGDPGYCRNEYH
jgi:hypothetical protein